MPAVLGLAGSPGARLIGNLIDVDPDQVVFSPIADGWQLPLFRPVP